MNVRLRPLNREAEWRNSEYAQYRATDCGKSSSTSHRAGLTDDMLKQLAMLMALVSASMTAWADARSACADGKNTPLDQLIATCSEVIRSDASAAWAYYNRGRAYHAKGDHDRAIADYNKAIEINPKFDEAHRNRGNAYADKAPIEKRFRGSGFFVSQDGLVLTNAHVVENCRQTTVRSAHNVGQGSILARDTQNDLALLASGLKPIRVATLRSSAKLGEEVVVFGYPLSGLLASSGNVTTGIVSALAGLRDDSRLLQISAPIQPGNSGGPVLDRRGDVIGVVVSRFTMTSKDAVQNVSFAIKNTGAISFLDAQAVAYSKAVEGAPPLPTEDLAERAKAFTVQIECSRLDGTSGSVATPILSVPPRLLTRCDGIEVLVGSERQCLKPKDSFKDCAECPEMVVIPAGEFMMGSNDGDSDEEPVHKVAIGRPFAVGKFEVTFAEWDACVAAGGCSRKPEDRGWGRGRQPVINVSWHDATKEYLPWLSRKTSKTYRLLTEAEWEYAARGVTSASAVHATYAWGNDIGKSRANCDGCGSPWDNKQTAPVGSFAANAFGLHDMHGNVWEWVQDCWHDTYQGAPTDGSAWITSCTDASRVVRGGSWVIDPRYLRAAYRGRYGSGFRYFHFGFRVGRTLDGTTKPNYWNQPLPNPFAPKAPTAAPEAER